MNKSNDINKDAPGPSSKNRLINAGLLLLAALVAIFPLMIVRDSEFGGADGQAGEVIEEMHEGEFEPWFTPLWEPPGGETESLLFALQAALGSGVMFYCLGYLKGKNARKERETPQA